MYNEVIKFYFFMYVLMFVLSILFNTLSTFINIPTYLFCEFVLSFNIRKHHISTV